MTLPRMSLLLLALLAVIPLQALGQSVPPAAGAGGSTTRHRITWTPNPDGSVRQFWESTDATGEWTVAFDGRYVRRTVGLRHTVN